MEEYDYEEYMGIQTDTNSDESDGESVIIQMDEDERTYGGQRIHILHNPITAIDRTLIHHAAMIYLQERDFMDSEKINNTYYIGSASLINNKYYVLNTAITSATFLEYPYSSIMYYLREYSLFYLNKNRFEIMKLKIHPITGEYIVELKTFWLRIVQRTWRRILRERQDIIKKRCSITNIKHRTIYGRYLPGLNVLPGLIGMIHV